MDLGSASGEIRLLYSGAGVAQAKQDLGSLESAGGNAGKALTAVGTAGAALGAAIAAPLGLAVKSAASFEQQMDAVSAALGIIPGSSAEADAAFQQLSDTALRIGKDTAFSAGEAGMAMEELAKLGIGAEDIVGGVADATVNLAAAIGEGLPQSAAAIGAVLNTFELDATDAANVTDTLTAAINESATSLPDFMAGFRNLGSAAAGMGVSFEDTAAAIAYFTNFGLKGADVGVSLARALENLATPTDEAQALMQQLGISAFDAQGEFVGFPDLMDQLNASMSGMSDEARQAALATLFGAEAADVMGIAVQKGGDGLREMTDAVQPAGQAAEQAAARMDNLAGAVEELKGSLETAAIILGSTLIDPIRAITEAITGLVNAFIGLDPAVQQFIGSFAAGAAALLTFGGGAALTVGKVIQLADSFAKAGLSLGKFALGLGLAGAALAAGIIAYQTNFLGFRDAVDGAVASLGEFKDTFADVFAAKQKRGMNALAAGVTAFGRALDAAFGTSVSDELDNLGRAIQAAGDAFQTATANGLNPAAAALLGLGAAADQLGFTGLGDQLQSLAADVQYFGEAFRKTSADLIADGDRYSEIAANVDAFGQALKAAFGIDVTGVTDRLADALDAFAIAAERAASEGAGPLEQAFRGLQAAAESLTGLDLQGVADALGNIGGTIRDVGAALAGGDFSRAGEILRSAFDGLSGFLQEQLGNASAQLQEWFNQIGQTLASVDLGEIAVNIAGWVQGRWEDLKGWLESQTGIDLDSIDLGSVTVVWEWIKGAVEDVWSWLQGQLGIGQSELSGSGDIASGSRSVGDVALGAVTVTWEWIKGAVEDLGAWLQAQFGSANAGSELSGSGDIAGNGRSIDLGQIAVTISGFTLDVADALTKIDTALDTFVQDHGLVAKAEEAGRTLGEALGGALAAAIGAGIAAALGGGGGRPGGGTPLEGVPAMGPGAMTNEMNFADVFAAFDTSFTEAVKAALEPEFAQAEAALKQWIEERKTNLWNAIWDVLFLPVEQDISVDGQGGGLSQDVAEGTGGPLQGLLDLLGQGIKQTSDEIGGADLVPGAGAQELEESADQAATSLGEAFGKQFAEALGSDEFITAFETGIEEVGAENFQGVAEGLLGRISEAMTQALASGPIGGDVGAASETGSGATALGGGMAEQFITAIAAQLQEAAGAIDPAIFAGVGQAIMQKIGEALSQAMSAAGTQGAELAGSGDIAGAGAGIGESIVSSLASSLAASVAAAPPESFAPIGTALLGKISEAMSAAFTQTGAAGQSGRVGADAAGGLGTSIAQSLATSLASAITEAPVEAFAAVGTALQTKLTEVLNSALSGAGGAGGRAPSPGLGGGGESGIGQAIAEMLASSIAGADFSAVATAIQEPLVSAVQTAITAATSAASAATSIGSALVAAAASGIGGGSGGAVPSPGLGAGSTPAAGGGSFDAAVTGMVQAGISAGTSAASGGTAIGAALQSAAAAGIGGGGSGTGGVPSPGLGGGSNPGGGGGFSGAVTSMVQAGIDAGVGAAAGASAIGAAISSGAASGVVLDALVGPVQEMVNRGIAAGMAAAEAASPSRRAERELGEPIGQGAAIGVDNTADQFVGSVEGMVGRGLDAGEALLNGTVPLWERAGSQLGGALGSGLATGLEGLNLDPAALGIPEEGRALAQSIIDSVLGRLESQAGVRESVAAATAQRVIGEHRARRDEMASRGQPIQIHFTQELDGDVLDERIIETAWGAGNDAMSRNPLGRSRR